MGAFRATRKTGPLIGAGSDNAELAPGEDGQSSTVAFCVTNFGPACIADAIFSASDFGVRDAGTRA
jgi:hypothetical protein